MTKEKEDKKNKNSMEYGGIYHKYERQYHYNDDDDVVDEWAESPLTSSCFLFHFIYIKVHCCVN